MKPKLLDVKERNKNSKLHQLKNNFIFTPFGFIVLVLSFAILFRSLFNRNTYEIIFSSAVLLLLLVLFIFGKRKSLMLKNFEAAWKVPYPYFAEMKNEKTIIAGYNVSIPLFFRLHFIVCGNFFLLNSAQSCSAFAETVISQKEKTTEFILDFPMSGIFYGEYQCKLRDIFGLFSLPCGIIQQKKIIVRSAPFFKKKFFLNTKFCSEDKQNKTSSNEERYYMREYSPGDRLRDINWKSSEKLDVLVTRISPDNQEKVNRIEIYFRNFGSQDAISLDSLWALDRAKAKLSYFLKNINDTYSSNIFYIHSAEAVWEIKNKDELEFFFDELASISFAPQKNNAAMISQNAKNDLFVFSTAYDIELNEFLSSFNPEQISLFFVQPLGFRKEKNKSTIESEIFFKRNFFLKNCFISPMKLFTKNANQRIPLSGRIAVIPTNNTDILYTETIM